MIERAIATDFGLEVKVTLRDAAQMHDLLRALPAEWVNDTAMRCDVMFLWPEVDSRAVLKTVPASPAIEDVRYEPGALIWRIDRKNVPRSRIPKMIGTPLYKQLTARNVSTVRKLCALMQDR
jgi:uncharacterized protein (DUF1697 family)